jgi:hypothetical protein
MQTFSTSPSKYVFTRTGKTAALARALTLVALSFTALVNLTGEDHTVQDQENACINDQIDNFYTYRAEPVRTKWKKYD